MSVNLLNLWLLARLVQAAITAALGLGGGLLGGCIAWRWRAGQPGEAQLALERLAELAAAVMQVALLLQVFGLALSLFVTDHLVGGIRGAMCAFGVLASTRSGFPGLAAGTVTALVCALWMLLHRLDLSLESPVLTRRKFAALLVVAPLTLVDFLLAVRFASELDFSVIASCCSVWLDDTAVNEKAARLVVSPNLAASTALATALLAAGAALLLRRRPGRATAILVAASSLAAAVAAVPAVLGVVAPYALATPAHLCPFCLLRAQAGGLGWPLFAALFLGTVAGLGVGMVELQGLPGPAREHARRFQRRLAGWCSLGWISALACGSWPIVRFLIRSGGVSVFGEV